jgi:putative transposase
MRREPIVTVVAYCLMPNHFHTCLSETSEGGIEKFMHTICTAYATYYNIKYKHSGTIFQGNYKCKHVDTDEYLQYLIEYIHLNPFGIENPDLLKSVKMEYRNEAIAYSEKYEYSSFRDYLGVKRPQNMIVEVYPRG